MLLPVGGSVVSDVWFVAIKLAIIERYKGYCEIFSVVAMAKLKVIKHPILFLSGLELETYTF